MRNFRKERKPRLLFNSFCFFLYSRITIKCYLNLRQIYDIHRNIYNKITEIKLQTWAFLKPWKTISNSKVWYLWFTAMSEKNIVHYLYLTLNSLYIRSTRLKVPIDRFLNICNINFNLKTLVKFSFFYSIVTQNNCLNENKKVNI